MSCIVVFYKSKKELPRKIGSIDELYKVCGFSSPDDFSCVHTEITLEGYILAIYGKTKGNKNEETKEPYGDTTLYGNYAYVMSTIDGEIIDVDLNRYEIIDMDILRESLKAAERIRNHVFHV